MNLPRVDAELLPPFSLPFRFFMTAQGFAIAASLWLLWAGPGVWITRWHPVLLGVTHLLVLGAMAMVMIGALAQIVPVLAMRPLPKAEKLLPVIHLFLMGGIVALAAALGLGRPLWLQAALPLLGGAFVLLIGMLAFALLGRNSGRGAIHSIRLAGFALALTVGLGVWMAAARLWPDNYPMSRILTDTHALLGLGGWVGLLILGVGSQVIPMFHVTPAFPPRLLGMLNIIGMLGLLLLVAGSSLSWVDHSMLWLGGAWTLGAVLGTFGVSCLVMLGKRSRRIPDATLRAWRVAITSFLCVLGLLALTQIAPLPAMIHVRLQLAAALLLLFGVIQIVILGMLLKIVPFLAWTHLQNLCGLDFEKLMLVPHMHGFIPSLSGRRLVHLQAFSALGLALAPLFNLLHYPALALLGISQLWGALLIARAWIVYRRVARTLETRGL